MISSANRIELMIKKDSFLGRLNKVELVFKDRQTKEELAVNLDKSTLMILGTMVETMNAYYSHNEFYITEDGEHNGEVVLKVAHKKSAYVTHAHYVAYVMKSSFLEMIDGLAYKLK
jgi:hypothetical protein